MGCRIDVEEALNFLAPRRSPISCLRRSNVRRTSARERARRHRAN